MRLSPIVHGLLDVCVAPSAWQAVVRLSQLVENNFFNTESPGDLTYVSHINTPVKKVDTHSNQIALVWWE